MTALELEARLRRLVCVGSIVGAFTIVGWYVGWYDWVADTLDAQSLERQQPYISLIHEGKTEFGNPTEPDVWHIGSTCVAQFGGYKSQSAVVVPCPWEKR